MSTIIVFISHYSPMDLNESHTRFSLEEHNNEGAHDRGSVRLSSALQLLQEDTGRSISAQANSTPQDSFFSFLLLRHLHIRDLRSKVNHPLLFS